MAVLQKGQRTNTVASGSQSDATEQSESRARVVDILQDKSLPTGTKMKLAVQDGKPLEDAWEFAAPPDEGRYSLRILLGKDPVNMYYADEKNPDPADVTYTIGLECKLTDEAYVGSTVFAGLSTRIARGKNISTAAGFLWKLGYKIPEEVTHRDLAKLVVQCVMKEPSLDAFLKWQGWSKLDSRVAYPNQAAFPFDVETGKHSHIVEYKSKSGQIEEIRAQLKVDHWFGKKDTEDNYKGSGVGVGVGSKTNGPVPNFIRQPSLALVEESAMVQPQQAQAQQTRQTVEQPTQKVTNTQAQDDLFAALEEA